MQSLRDWGFASDEASREVCLKAFSAPGFRDQDLASAAAYLPRLHSDPMLTGCLATSPDGFLRKTEDLGCNRQGICSVPVRFPNSRLHAGPLNAGEKAASCQFTVPYRPCQTSRARAWESLQNTARSSWASESPSCSCAPCSLSWACQDTGGGLWLKHLAPGRLPEHFTVGVCQSGQHSGQVPFVPERQDAGWYHTGAAAGLPER